MSRSRNKLHVTRFDPICDLVASGFSANKPSPFCHVVYVVEVVTWPKWSCGPRDLCGPMVNVVIWSKLSRGLCGLMVFVVNVPYVVTWTMWSHGLCGLGCHVVFVVTCSPLSLSSRWPSGNLLFFEFEFAIGEEQKVNTNGQEMRKK